MLHPLKMPTTTYPQVEHNCLKLTFEFSGENCLFKPILIKQRNKKVVYYILKEKNASQHNRKCLNRRSKTVGPMKTITKHYWNVSH